jgi:hypothetical protein
MAQTPDDIRQSITDTRHEMAETRASMTDKLEALEERVGDTVAGAKSTAEDLLENVQGTVGETAEAIKETVGAARSTVAGMVENVRGTLDDTVSRVQQSFNLRSQVDRHPWVMFGGSLLAGYLLGGLGTKSTARSYRTRRTWTGTEAEHIGGYFTATAPPEAEYHPASASQLQTRTSSLWQRTLGQFQDEVDMLKGAVIVALMRNVRDMAKQSLPGIAPHLEKAVESAAAKVGTSPLTEGKQQERGSGPARERREQPPGL